MLSNRKGRFMSKPSLAKKSGSSVKKRPAAPRKEWNSYLTDGDRFKMTKEEELRKKQLYVSRHNILAADSDIIASKVVSDRPVKGCSKPSSSPTNTAQSTSTPQLTAAENEEVNALDLLGSDNEQMHDNTPKSYKRKTTGSSGKRPAKKAADGSNSDRHRDIGTTAKRLAFGRHDTRNDPKSSPKKRGEMTVECNDAPEGSVTSSTFGAGQTSPPFKSSHSTGFTSPRRSFSATKASPSPARQRLSHGKMNTSFGSGAMDKEKPKEADKDYDLVYVADEVKSLFAELKFYEELSGRRSILETREELEEMLRDEALREPEQHKPVMRYLVNLVCQSMTYLLKSEVDLQDQRKHYEHLRAQYETLHTLLGPDTALSAAADFMGPSSDANAGASAAGAEAAESEAMDVASLATSTPGIAFRSDDLYPHAPGMDRDNTRLVDATAYTPFAAPHRISAASTASASAGMETTSALRRLAQQYAQDEQYPVPTDVDGAQQDYLAASLSSIASAAPVASPILSAKHTTTPARFQQRLDGSQQPMQDTKAAKLAKNLPPAMVASTPVRQAPSATKQNPYNSVSSTASTPMVHRHPPMPAVMPRTATAAAAPTEQSLSQMYPYLNTPALYTDGPASYLPGTRKVTAGAPSRAAPAAEAVPSTPSTLQSRAIDATERSDFLGADLSRVDELLERSRRIAAAPALSFTPGGEFSTISRLAETIQPTHQATGDDSILSSPRMGANMSVLDTSMESVQRAQREPLDPHRALYDSHDTTLTAPPPPPPSYGVGVTPMRQPALATASREQLQHIQVNSAGAGFAVPGVTTLPGTSPSDWLFGAFPGLTQPQASQGRVTTPQEAHTVVTPTTQVVGLNTPPREGTAPKVLVPQGAMHGAAKTRTPATNPLYQFSAAQTLAEGDSALTDATIERLTQQLGAALTVGTPPSPPSRTVTQRSSEGQTPEQHGSTQQASSRPALVAAKRSIVQVKRTLPGKTSAPQLQEGPSMIAPHGAAPSPQAAPVHPFAHKQVSSVRGTSFVSNSKQNTPTSSVAVEPWPLGGRTYDARNGSY